MNGSTYVLNSSEETANLLEVTVRQVLTFLRKADDERQRYGAENQAPATIQKSILMNSGSVEPAKLQAQIAETLSIPAIGQGSDGFNRALADVLKYSVNTSAPGFLDKLYAAPLPPGIAAELVLGVLNTNVHIYSVSPVLTLIEKQVTKELAGMFGLKGPRSGGINTQGGSASNLTSIIVARDALYPETKINGNAAVPGRLLLFTSAHGHYSVEKAAQAIGLGTRNVVTVPVDDSGCMIASDLDRLIVEAKANGDSPFYINATAGSTVLGSFDNFTAISSVAKNHGLWMHVDASWGGGFIFSNRTSIRDKLKGIDLADSIATNPHKMLGVPLTCSFLLGRDMRQFQQANTLKAGYLFHDQTSLEPTPLLHNDADDLHAEQQANGHETNNALHSADEEQDWTEPNDLADLTMQCGRRGDALKFFMSLQYYGTQGYAAMVDRAYEIACYLSTIVEQQPDLTPVLARGRPPDCLQVCFYFTPAGQFASEYFKKDASATVRSRAGKARTASQNTHITATITRALVSKGFMIDFAPALDEQEDRGSFFRVVVNISTNRATVDRLISELVITGRRIVSAAAPQAVSPPI